MTIAVTFKNDKCMYITLTDNGCIWSNYRNSFNGTSKYK